MRVLLVLLLASGLAIGAFVYWDEIQPPGSQYAGLRGAPSRLENQRVPGFTLPGLIGDGFAARDLMASRRPIVVVFWGSWGPQCIQQHPVLMDLQASGVPVWGIAFRDTRTRALDYLERNGNPYARLGLDASGRVATDWGVREAPATFLVDGEGFVRWYHSGPLTQQVVARQLRPQIDRWAP